MIVLVTGASGFVGRAVAARLHDEGMRVRATSRTPAASLPAAVEQVRIGDLSAHTDWRDALQGVEVVVHAAARVHVMQDTATDPLAEFRRVNVAGTAHLAREAARAGTRRFVFLSSIKVNGEGTSGARPYRADDPPAPVDPYGISKREAEDELRRIARETGLEVVIIRPVLVYGPGVKGNFLSLLRCVHRRLPLPFGAVDNRRSLVALDNLVDLVVTAIRHPNAPNRVFLVSDGVDLSTSELLRRTARALGTRARLLAVPPGLLELGARLVGKRNLANRLFGSLQVDIAPTREVLGWEPPLSVDAALARTARHYLEQRTT